MKEKIKQILHKNLFLIEQENWYNADEIAEEIAKVFSSNAVLADSFVHNYSKDTIERVKKNFINGNEHDAIKLLMEDNLWLWETMKKYCEQNFR